MTTNITPIEALKTIKEKLQIHPIPSTNDQLCYEIWECIDIATQALAPQECDVSKCLFLIKHDPPEDSGTWGGAIHKGACKVNSTDCKDTPDCFIKKLYQQLRSQQKTFTLEEIKEIAEKRKVCFNSELFKGLFLNEFEKEVNK